MRLPADVLAIFVKALEPGRVKTRIAAVLGAEPAARLYREMGRGIVAGCISPSRHRTVVWFAPASGETAIRGWLASLAVSGYCGQRDGGLGARMTAAYQRHFAEGAYRVVLIGSDCPEVGAPLVEQAFRALERVDLVIGPARDGGFYLLGLKSPAPGLFRHIEWSTDVVFRQAMLNAARLGLSTHVLPELRDVDTVADARALRLLPPVPLTRDGTSHGHAGGR